MNWLVNPTFQAYAVAAVLLCLNLMFLWAYSGFVRVKTKTTLNEEDAPSQHATVVAADPPPVARVLRAHQNAQATILPFLLLGLVYVLLNSSATSATLAVLLFGVFTIARWMHTVVYLRGLQPWRTIAFALSIGAMAVLMAVIAWRVLRAALLMP